MYKVLEYLATVLPHFFRFEVIFIIRMFIFA